MPPKKDSAGVLAERMVQVLEARGPGAESSPLTLRRLAELADPQADPALVEKAVGRKPFKERVVLAQKKNLDTLLALQENLGELAASPRLLEAVLGQLGRPPHPGWPISKLKTKVDTRLKQPLEQAVQRQIRENRLPPSVEQTSLKNKTFLFLRSLPPLPPPKKPEVELAERMVQVLEAERGRGPESYPLPLEQVAARTGLPASTTLVLKAAATRPFAERVLVPLKKQAAVPVALVEDRERLAASPLLLTFTLQTARTDRSQAFTVEELKKKLVPPLRQPFQDAVQRQMDTGALAAGLGWVLAGKKKLLFHMRDVHGQGVTTTPQPVTVGPPPVSPPPLDFAATFEDVFIRLDRQAGGHNFVSLVELRKVLPFDRLTFDRELRKLRLAGRYTLSAAEGRHGLSGEERAAGIAEEGTLLLFVSRRNPS